MGLTSGASSSPNMLSRSSNCAIGSTVGCLSTLKPVALSSLCSTFSALMARFNRRYTTPGVFSTNLYTTKLLPVPFSPRITTYLPVSNRSGSSCSSISLRSTQSSGGASFRSSCAITFRLNGLSIDATAARSAKSSELAYFSSASSSLLSFHKKQRPPPTSPSNSSTPRTTPTFSKTPALLPIDIPLHSTTSSCRARPQSSDTAVTATANSTVHRC
ncbi:hypothetical protein B484DRAFT_446556 [Ochromonadaceae sp. CCMP2298]|nr:hypothetical protein B484DRAFT_446556 [Ochromonadaceae sp. CCMP2298]